jgi:Protein of unknown function (DUF3224)
MQNRACTSAAWICLALGLSGVAYGQTQAAAPTLKETAMSAHASGTFDVKVSPQALSDTAADATLGRMSLDKQYHGDLEGTGKGEMLTAGSGEGSGAYVAVERVTGKLKGRSGSFSLQHRGVMTRGTPDLLITVVPDSGTGELAGLAGKMTIKIENGKHFYELEHTLPNP